MAESEQTNLDAEVEFVYYKVNTFTEKHVYKEMIPEVNAKLAEIKKEQDNLVMKWLKHKVFHKGHAGLATLENSITELSEYVESNEMKVRLKVASLKSGNESQEQKLGQNPDQNIRNMFNKPSYAKKKREFNDQVDLLSISCGLDLGNPCTELDHDELVAMYENKEKDDLEISRLVRESKSWNNSLIALSKVYRDYEELAQEGGEDSEELTNNQTIFDTAKSRLLDLKKVIEDEDTKRNLFTLDNTKVEKVKFPTFSGEKREDFLKFKEKMLKAFQKNRVVLGDQLDKLRENLKGEALKHVPDTVPKLEIAWKYLNDAYGDPLRILKERIKFLDSMKFLPPLKKKEARVTWFLEFESVLDDIIQLGGDSPGIRSYCAAYSEFTVEKVLSALPEEGEDVRLRADLSRVVGDGKELFENMKAKITEFRQNAQAFVGNSGSLKKSSTSSGSPANLSSRLFNQAKRLDSCKICTLVSSDPNFITSVEPFDSHVGSYPTHCPTFISFSIAKRKAIALQAKMCLQCLDPEVVFSRDHLSKCPVSSKNQFYTCKETGCRSHIWLCTRHKDQTKNKSALEQIRKSLKSKHDLDFCMHVEVMTCKQFSGSVENASKLLQEVADNSGKKLLPPPVGNPLFLFFAAKGKTRPVQTFVDSGSSDVLMKEGIPGNELPGFRIREGPIHLKGVGGLTAVATGEWLTCMERKDGRLQAMQVITMEQVTGEFPRINIVDAVNEIKQDKLSFKELQNLKLPEEVGGSDTDCLLGIKLQDIYPREVHSLPCGLTIYKSKLVSHDGRTNAMIGGAHSTFSSLVSQVGGHGILLSMFVQGLAGWRSFGSLPLTHYEVGAGEKLMACMDNLGEDDETVFEEVLREEFVVENNVCNTCSKSLSAKEILESTDRLSLLKRAIEIQGPLDVEYRCIDCRDCRKCQSADKLEKMSLKEEAEMMKIRDSIHLNYEDKRIDCTLPLRGAERDFMATNNRQAVAILNQQCQKYSADPEVRTSINKAFAKLMDRGFIRLVSDLSAEELAEFEGKEVQYTIPWRVVWKESTTTPVRPVLDASTNSPKRPDGSGGSSLNNAVCHGKVDSLDLLGVLLRFVMFKHAVAADITKMYNMFNLVSKYWNLQRIVMKKDLDPNGDVIDAVITTLIYGVSSVSCQTEEASAKIAANCRKEHPEAADCIEKSRYVDNLLKSFKSREEALEVTGVVDECFAELSLFTRGWSHTGEAPVQEESADGVSLELMGIRWFPFFDTLQIKIPRLHFGKKVRGRLDPNAIFFEGDFAKMSSFVPDALTRKQIVSKRASIFDMFGKITPVTAKLKRFEKEVLNFTKSWDEAVSEQLRLQAIKNFIMIEKLRGIHYQRAKIPVDAVSEIARTILVVDAAEDILIFTVYIGFKKEDDSWSCDHLIGRSALSSLTIPRNEMQSMMAGSNLAWLVRKALNDNIGEQVTCGDSEIVLHWILSDHRRLEPWHRNRVVQIRRAIDLENLYHVSSKNNVADVGTRSSSITEEDVLPGSRYLVGDPWMRLDVSEAVEKKFITPAAGLKLSPDKSKDYSEGLVLEPDIPEVVVKGHSSHPDIELSGFTSTRRDLITQRAEFSQYDPDLLPTKKSFPKMLRICTLVMTFLNKLMKKTGNSFKGSLLSPCSVKLSVTAATSTVQALATTQVDLVKDGVRQQDNAGVTFLQTQEVSDGGHTDTHVQLALLYYFRLAAREVKEFNSKALIDKIAVEVDGLLLSKSRIHDVLNFIETGDLKIKDLGPLNIRAKVPVSDRYSPLSYSIASYIHGAEHKGVESSFRICQEQVHIIKGFSLFKEIDSECIKCKKKRGKFSKVLMGPVDENQVTVAPAFFCCQIDLWGPVKVFCPGFERDTRNSKAKETKNWVLVAACTTTKALNIQVVDKSDCRGILEALIRLGCEAGWPKFFYCDADSAILKIMEELNVEIRDLQYRLHAEYGAVFEVCPVGGHERQGLVERRIATVQSSLKQMGMDTMRIHSMGLQTMCKMVENTLNNLPYGYTQVRGDTNQSLYKLISPNLLRHGRNNNRAIEGSVRLSADNSKMLKDVEARNAAWFKIFKDSCVPRLVMQQKWFKNEKDLAVGDLVFFRKTDSELGEGDWTVGMVDQVIPSKDKLIRQVIVKYRNKTEDFDRFSKRNSRKLVRLCNVEDSGLWDDLSWVQQRVQNLNQTSQLTSDGPQSSEADDRLCQLCCCTSHCQVRFHSLGRLKKPLLVTTTMNIETIGGNDTIELLGVPGPDMEATIANMEVEESFTVEHMLKNEVMNL